MSISSFEREILYDLQVATGNHKLRMKNVMEWRTGKCEPKDGELYIELPSGIHVCYTLPEKKSKVAPPKESDGSKEGK